MFTKRKLLVFDSDTKIWFSARNGSDFKPKMVFATLFLIWDINVPLRAWLSTFLVSIFPTLTFAFLPSVLWIYADVIKSEFAMCNRLSSVARCDAWWGGGLRNRPRSQLSLTTLWLGSRKWRTCPHLEFSFFCASKESSVLTDRIVVLERRVKGTFTRTHTHTH